METLAASPASGRTARRRRALAALVCVFLAGTSLGTAVGLTYTRAPHRQYEKAFDSIGLTTGQRHATDSIMARYACVIDSVYRSVTPHVDSIRHLARQDVQDVLNEAQISQFNRALGAEEAQHGSHRSDKHTSCDHTTDSASFLGHSRHLRL